MNDYQLNNSGIYFKRCPDTGVIHSDDGSPAVVFAKDSDGKPINPFTSTNIDIDFIRKEWWNDGKRHRRDAPAVEVKYKDIEEFNSMKSLIVEWYLDGKHYRESEFEQFMIDAGWPDEKIVEWKLTNVK